MSATSLPTISSTGNGTSMMAIVSLTIDAPEISAQSSTTGPRRASRSTRKSTSASGIANAAPM